MILSCAIISWKIVLQNKHASRWFSQSKSSAKKKRKLAVENQKKNVEQISKIQRLERPSSRPWNAMEDWLALFGTTVTYQVLLQSLLHLLAIKWEELADRKNTRASTNNNTHMHTLSLDLLFIQFTYIVQSCNCVGL